MNTSESTIIEQQTLEADYGFAATEAVVDHEKHGRIYICEGYGGEDSLAGGCVRWKHGTVIKLGNEDTLENLKSREWNEGTSYYSAMKSGYYGEILNWTGHAVEGLAKQIGLA
jgi:hypothetical protein